MNLASRFPQGLLKGYFFLDQAEEKYPDLLIITFASLVAEYNAVFFTGFTALTGKAKRKPLSPVLDYSIYCTTSISTYPAESCH